MRINQLPANQARPNPVSNNLGYFGAAFLFTLKFDEAGHWKIVKTREMSDKEIEKYDRS